MQKNLHDSSNHFSENTDTIAIIGAGNMGTSLLGGLIAKHHPPEKIWITGISTEKLGQLQKKFKVHATTNNVTAIEKAKIVIFAIKPQIFAHITLELAAAIQRHKPLIISVATGITAASIQRWLGGEMAIVRSMPNTPTLIGCGATALFANEYVTKNQRHLAETILSAVGITLWLNKESLLDTVTALSGSGPAYFFLMMEALQQAGEKLGLPQDVARLLTLQTAYGAAQMALASEKSLLELRAAVTSPNGTTEQALKVLEKARIRDIMADTLLAAQKRAEELSKEFG